MLSLHSDMLTLIMVSPLLTCSLDSRPSIKADSSCCCATVTQQDKHFPLEEIKNVSLKTKRKSQVYIF